MGKQKRRRSKRAADSVIKDGAKRGEEETRVELLLRRAENHPLLATLILTGLCVVAVSGLVDAIQRLGSAGNAIAGSFMPVATPAEQDHAKAVQVVAQETGQPTSSISGLEAQWFGLVDTNKPTECWVTYELGTARCAALYSVRSGRPERLFFDQAGTKFAIAKYDDRAYLVAWSHQGSGGFLELTLLSWDGAGPLKPEFEYGHDGSGFQGDLVLVNSRVFVGGSGQKFELHHGENGFKLVDYAVHPQYPDMGDSCHVLRILAVDGGLAFTFDGERVEFDRVSDDRSVSRRALRLTVGESLLVDDNLGQHRDIRALADGDALDWVGKLYPMLKALRPGQSKVSIDDSYTMWYEVRLQIER